jgi:hypothetical protein
MHRSPRGDSSGAWMSSIKSFLANTYFRYRFSGTTKAVPKAVYVPPAKGCIDLEMSCQAYSTICPLKIKPCHRSSRENRQSVVSVRSHFYCQIIESFDLTSLKQVLRCASSWRRLTILLRSSRRGAKWRMKWTRPLGIYSTFLMTDAHRVMKAARWVCWSG